MSWWTTVAGLTPLAVHDAANVSGAQLLDCVGTNHITASSELAVVGDKLIHSVLGDGAAMSYASPVTLPTNCTICALIRDTNSGPGITVFSDTSANGFIFDHESGYGQVWVIAKAAGGGTAFGAAAFSSSFQFLTVVKTGLDAVMYIDGVQLGGTLTDKLPPSIDRVGSGSNASYTFQTTDNLAALGIWDGAATQAEVISLEAACRAALTIEGTARGFTGLLGRLDSTPPGAVDPPGAVVYPDALDRLPLFENLYSGPGQITGTVKKKALPNNLPLDRKVRLYHDRSGQLVAETWSDAVTGVYLFQGLDLGEVYTALALDHTHTFRAVAADNLAATR
jgi:hypothetical protein